MAQAFNLTAQLNLRGPTNVRQIAAGIRRDLGNLNATVNFKLDPAAVRNTTALNGALRNLNSTFSATTRSATNATSAIRSFASSINSINVKNIPQQLNASATAVVKLNQAASKSQQALASAHTEMQEFGKQAGLAVRRFAAFTSVTSVIYSVTNSISQGVQAFIEYDKELVRLQQVTGESAQGLAQLQKQITTLSTSFGVSSKDLTSVASTLAQAGLSAKDTERSLKALALSSLAPSFDNMNETVEGSIALMRQFGISAGDLEQALGSINSVAAKFAVESRDIITAIQRTGSVFATASKGVSEGKDALNEFIAVFTSIRATTRESAETIATGLRTIFTRIQRGSTIDALKEFGVNLSDAEGKFVGAYKAVELLSQGLNKIDPRSLDFSRIVEELGGFRQIGKVIPLIQQFGTAQEALKVAQKGQGSLAKDAATAQLSLANQIAKVREEFFALFREIGQSRGFQTVIKGALDLASAFIKIADSVKGVLPVLAVLTAFRGASALTQFAGGFFGAIKGQKKHDGGTIRKFARGGLVPGSGDGDTVPAMLEPGEFVIRKKAVETIGTSNLQKMNRYAKGGPVEKYSASRALVKNLDSTFDKEAGTPITSAINKTPRLVLNKKDTLGVDIDRIGWSGQQLAKANPNSVSSKIYLTTKNNRQRGLQFENLLLESGKITTKGGGSSRLDGITPDGNFVEIKSTKSTSDKELFEKAAGAIFNPITENVDKVAMKKASQKALSSKPDDIGFGKLYEFFDTDVRRKAMGGTIQKFKIGGRALGARSKFKELTSEEIGQLPTKDLIKYGKRLARNIFTTGGAGMAVGSEFVEVSPQNIVPELESSLVSYMGKRGFWREQISPFGKPSKQIQKINQKSGRQKALDKQIAQHADEVAAREQQWTKIRPGSSIDKYLLTTLKDPILSDYITSKTGAPLAKTFHETRLRQAVNKALEKYDDFDYSAGNIDKLVSGIANKRFSSGGTIQKFMAGGIAEAILGKVPTLSELVSGPFAANKQFAAGEKNWKQILSEILASQGIPYDTTSGSIRLDTPQGVATVSLKDAISPQQLKAAKFSSRVGAANIAKLTTLRDLIQARYVEGRGSVIESTRPRTASEAAAAQEKDLMFGAVGMLGKEYDRMPLRISKGITNPVDVVVSGRRLDPTIAQKMDRSFSRTIDKTTRKDARQAMIGQIIKDITGGNELVLDFDRTLALGADKIIGDPKKPKFSEFGDRTKVSQALQTSRLSGLGKSLVGLINQSEPDVKSSLLERMSVLTARPQSTLDLIQSWLTSKGLPITKFTGVGGTGVTPEQIAQLKASLIPSGASFVDDDKRNIEAAEQKGIKSYLYKFGKKQESSDITSAKGILFQDIVERLGAPKRNPNKKSIDFPFGLGSAAKYFDGLPPNIPTDAKRTISSASDLTENITNYLIGMGRATKVPKKQTVKKNLGGLIQKFAVGGSVEDTVPALLTPGEFVINKKAAQRIGYSRLHRLNKADKLQGYNKGGVVQHFADGGIPVRPDMISSSTIKIDTSATTALQNLRDIIQQLGLTGSETAKLLQNTNNISYKSAEKAAAADLARAKASGASINQIIAAEKALGDIRNAKNKDVGKRNILESAFSGVSGRSSGSVQQEIISEANTEAQAEQAKQEKQLLNKKRLRAQRKIKSKLESEAIAKKGGVPLTLSEQAQINLESRKKAIEKVTTDQAQLTDKQKEKIYERSTINATSRVTGIDQKTLSRSGIKAEDIRQYAQESMMDRKALAEMDKQYRVIRLQELQAAGKTAKEAHILIEQELRDRRAAANAAAAQRGVAGPGSGFFDGYTGTGTFETGFGGRGILGGISKGIGRTYDYAADTITNIRSRSLGGNIAAGFRGVSRMGGALAGSGGFYGSMALGMLSGQGENIFGSKTKDANTASKVAGFEAGTSTMAAGLATASSLAMIPGVGPFAAALTMGVTVVKSWSSAVEAGKQAVLEFEQAARTKAIEEAADKRNKAFSEFEKDPGNAKNQQAFSDAIAKETSLNRENAAKRMEAIRQDSKYSTKETYYDDFMSRVGSMGAIVGMGGYDPVGDRRNARIAAIGQESKDQAKMAESLADASNRLIDGLIQAGVSLEQIGKDPRFSSWIDTIAEADVSYTTLINTGQLEEAETRKAILAQEALTNANRVNMASTLANARAMEAAEKAGRRLAESYDRLFGSVNASIGRARYESNERRKSNKARIDALNGNVEPQEVSLRELNILENRQSYSTEEYDRALSRATSLAPGDAGVRLKEAATLDVRLGDDVNSAIRSALGNRGDMELSQVADKAKSVAFARVDSLNLSKELKETLKSQIEAKLKTLQEQQQNAISKNGVAEKQAIDEFVEEASKAGNLLGETGKNATETAKALLQFEQETTNVLIPAILDSAKAARDASSLFRKSRDIMAGGQRTLKEVLTGQTESFAEVKGRLMNDIGGLTGGITDPAAIRQKIVGMSGEVEERTTKLKAANILANANPKDENLQNAAKREAESYRDFTVELNNAKEALDMLADSTELVNKALDDLKTATEMQKNREDFVNKLLTNTPDETDKLNQSFIRLQRNLSGGVNDLSNQRDARKAFNDKLRETGNIRLAQRAGNTVLADQRKETLALLKDPGYRASLGLQMGMQNPGITNAEIDKKLQDMELQVMKQMAKESGLANNPLVQQALKAKEDPYADPMVKMRADRYLEAIGLQSKATEEQAKLKAIESTQTLIDSNTNLRASIESLIEAIIQATNRDKIIEGVGGNKVPLPVNVAQPAAPNSKGGLIYASAGRLVDFQPRGTDTVPAMLTPGEFVINAKSTAEHLPLLQAINNGETNIVNSGGIIHLAKGGRVLGMNWEEFKNRPNFERSGTGPKDNGEFITLADGTRTWISSEELEYMDWKENILPQLVQKFAENRNSIDIISENNIIRNNYRLRRLQQLQSTSRRFNPSGLSAGPIFGQFNEMATNSEAGRMGAAIAWQHLTDYGLTKPMFRRFSRGGVVYLAQGGQVKPPRTRRDIEATLEAEKKEKEDIERSVTARTAAYNASDSAERAADEATARGLVDSEIAANTRSFVVATSDTSQYRENIDAYVRDYAAHRARTRVEYTAQSTNGGSGRAAWENLTDEQKQELINREIPGVNDIISEYKANPWSYEDARKAVIEATDARIDHSSKLETKRTEYWNPEQRKRWDEIRNNRDQRTAVVANEGNTAYTSDRSLLNDLDLVQNQSNFVNTGRLASYAVDRALREAGIPSVNSWNIDADGNNWTDRIVEEKKKADFEARAQAHMADITERERKLAEERLQAANVTWQNKPQESPATVVPQQPATAAKTESAARQNEKPKTSVPIIPVNSQTTKPLGGDAWLADLMGENIPSVASTQPENRTRATPSTATKPENVDSFVERAKKQQRERLGLSPEATEDEVKAAINAPDFASRGPSPETMERVAQQQKENNAIILQERNIRLRENYQRRANESNEPEWMSDTLKPGEDKKPDYTTDKGFNPSWAFPVSWGDTEKIEFMKKRRESEKVYDAQRARDQERKTETNKVISYYQAQVQEAMDQGMSSDEIARRRAEVDRVSLDLRLHPIGATVPSMSPDAKDAERWANKSYKNADDYFAARGATLAYNEAQTKEAIRRKEFESGVKNTVLGTLSEMGNTRVGQFGQGVGETLYGGIGTGVGGYFSFGAALGELANVGITNARKAFGYRPNKTALNAEAQATWKRLNPNQSVDFENDDSVGTATTSALRGTMAYAGTTETGLRRVINAVVGKGGDVTGMLSTEGIQNNVESGNARFISKNRATIQAQLAEDAKINPNNDKLFGMSISGMTRTADTAGEFAAGLIAPSEVDILRSVLRLGPKASKVTTKLGEVVGREAKINRPGFYQKALEKAEENFTPSGFYRAGKGPRPLGVDETLFDRRLAGTSLGKFANKMVNVVDDVVSDPMTHLRGASARVSDFFAKQKVAPRTMADFGPFTNMGNNVISAIGKKLPLTVNGNPLPNFTKIISKVTDTATYYPKKLYRSLQKRLSSLGKTTSATADAGKAASAEAQRRAIQSGKQTVPPPKSVPVSGTMAADRKAAGAVGSSTRQVANQSRVSDFGLSASQLSQLDELNSFGGYGLDRARAITGLDTTSNEIIGVIRSAERGYQSGKPMTLKSISDIDNLPPNIRNRLIALEQQGIISRHVTDEGMLALGKPGNVQSFRNNITLTIEGSSPKHRELGQLLGYNDKSIELFDIVRNNRLTEQGWTASGIESRLAKGETIESIIADARQASLPRPARPYPAVVRPTRIRPTAGSGASEALVDTVMTRQKTLAERLGQYASSEEAAIKLANSDVFSVNKISVVDDISVRNVGGKNGASVRSSGAASFKPSTGEIKLTPKTVSSPHLDATLNHELGHDFQHNTVGGLKRTPHSTMLPYEVKLMDALGGDISSFLKDRDGYNSLLKSIQGDKSLGSFYPAKRIMNEPVELFSSLVQASSSPKFNKNARAVKMLKQLMKFHGFSKGGLVYLSEGGWTSESKPSDRMIYANNGALASVSQGTDTVPAMLTPGEFVVNKEAAQRYTPILHAINSGHFNRGGIVNYLANGGIVAPKYYEGGGPVGGSGGSRLPATGGVSINIPNVGEMISQAVNAAVGQFTNAIQTGTETYTNMIQNSTENLTNFGQAFSNSIQSFGNSASSWAEAALQVPNTLVAEVTGRQTVDITGLGREGARIIDGASEAGAIAGRGESHNVVAHISKVGEALFYPTISNSIPMGSHRAQG